MKRLKTIFACMLMAVLSIGQVWATEATLDYSALGYTQTTALNGVELDADANVSITLATNGGSTAPSYYTTGTGARTYGSNTITVDAGSGTITQIDFNFTQNSKDYSVSAGTYSKTNSQWTGSANSVVFTTASGSGHNRIRSITVTYTPSGGDAKPTVSADPEEVENVAFAGVTDQTIDLTYENITDYETEVSVHPNEDGTGTLSPAWLTASISSPYSTVTYSVDANNGDERTAYIKVHATASGNKEATTIIPVSQVENFDGLKLNFDLSANNLSLPTAKGSSVAGNYTYTIGTTDYTFYATDAQGTSDGGIYFGGSYTMIYSSNALGLPAISGYKLVKVEASNSSGCSTSVEVSVREGQTSSDDIVSGGTAQTWGTQGSKYTYNLTGTEENTMYYLYVATKNCQLTGLTLYYEEAEAATVATPSISGTTPFLSSAEVTITCETDGATIYYTTDQTAGESTPTTEDPWIEYDSSSKPSLTDDATIYAAAKKGNDWSITASKAFTKIVPKTTAAQLVASVTTTEQQVYVKLENWKVNFVSGDYAYIVDTNNEGVVLKQTGHGYVAGNILGNEVVEVAAKKSSGRVQLSGFTSTEISATAGTASPSEVTDYSTITAANQSALVTLKSATYSSSTGTLSDGEHVLYYYDQFSANPTLVDGKNYDVTGIVIYYKTTNQEKIEIAPRTSEDVVPNEEIVIPTAANLAELKAATRGTYILTLTNAVVTYVNGKNVFIEEGTTGALIHLDTHSYEAGNCLNGDYQVTTEDFQGKFEITAIEPQAGAATTTAEIPLTTVTIATLNASFSSYESRRVKIVNANVTDAISGNDRNGAINDGAALAVYAAAGVSTITLTANDNVDIIGYPSFYNTNQQFNVWAQADITVNVKEDPELAYDPTVVNLTLDNLAAFTPAQLTYATGFDGVAAITYESSDPSIATVETDGTVTLVATEEGSTTITATFAGNSTYKADNASYTINVGAVPTYSMTFNLDKVSYDDASAAQVVWNSNVATMTIDQNDGTAVNNYLPGGYTSGQTIAPITESRFYTKNSISFAPKSGITITKVEWLATTATYASNLANATWVDADAVVDGTNNKLVIITPSSTGEFSVTLTAQVRATEAIVYYQAESEKARLTASIDIADFDMEIGQDDILLSDVVVTTSNPNKKAISYAVTSGSEYVSITGTNANQAFHALAAGTATITATIPSDLGNYTGATTTFEIEVKAATKLDAELAYDPESVVLTVGGTFNQAELTYATNFDGLADITYESNNENLATVAADGTVTLAEGKTGTATITATFPGNDNYYNDEASYTITINEAADDVTGTWTLVTNAANLAANKKVIVAQYVSEGDDIFTLGKQNGNNRLAIASTVSGSTLSPASGTKVITLVDAGNGLYALKLSNDKYLNASGGTSDNHLKEADDYSELVSAQWSIEITDNKAIITANFSGTNARNLMRYNPNNTNPDIFSCYKSGQNDIALYMLEEDEPEPPVEPEWTNGVRTDLNAGWYYTMCLDKAVTEVRGASIWRVLSKAENGSDIILEEVTGTLDAGRPYIFFATAASLDVIYTGDAVGAPITTGNNGLVGSFEQAPITANASNYIIYNNALYYVNSDNVKVGEHRAYLDMTGVPAYSIQGNAPGRRRVVMNVYNGNQMPTGIEGVEVSEAPRKVMIDGQLFILRDKKMYDASGRLVK